jgi:hemolysin activation/secretion protein
VAFREAPLVPTRGPVRASLGWSCNVRAVERQGEHTSRPLARVFRAPTKAVPALALLALLASPCGRIAADESAGATAERSAPSSRTRKIDVSEYRLDGAEQLTNAELEAVLAPFLGPGRELGDVEKARAAVEKAYSDKGFQSVTVAIPPQTVREGVVALTVTEGKVGRLRVRGARWFSPFDVRRQATSVAEGKVPNFNEIVGDVVALNQLPDRRVTPALRPGAAPGTIDVDLNVEDRPPFHGSLDLDNRQSANTTNLRLNGLLHYDNLFQRGHSLSFAFQTAPRRFEDAKVFSLSYLARVPGVTWLTLNLNGVLQDSDVSTLGSMAVKGKGRIFGARAMFTLPSTAEFLHTISWGFDYKRFEENLTLADTGSGATTLQTPVTYWPVTTQYAATWLGDRAQTQLTTTVIFNVRALGTDPAEIDAKRYDASGNFIYYRAEASRTQDLRHGPQLFARLQGQYTKDPVLSSEQFTAGGAESVRGYLEAEGAGDYGALGSFEVRTPSFARWLDTMRVDEWRLLAFFEGGKLLVREALPEQRSFFLLWGTGVGTRLRFLDHLSAAADVGVPLTSTGATRRYHPKFHLRVAGDF